MNGKKFLKRIFSTTLSAVMCVSVFAQSAASAEYISIKNFEGESVAAPLPGGYEVSAPVSEEAQLITVLYDSEGKLSKTELSAKTANPGVNVNVPTVDGFLMKNFLWTDKDGLKPLIAAQTNGVYLKASYEYGRTVLEWKRYADLGEITYRILRDGEIIAENIPENNATWFDADAEKGMHTYCVAAVLNGETAAVSNSVSVNVTKEQVKTYTFDPKKAFTNGLSGKNAKTYGADDKQIIISRDASQLTLNEDKTLIGGNDSGWTFDTVDGEKVFYTGYNAKADGSQPRGGSIHLGFGDKITGAAGEKFSAAITFDYKTDAKWRLQIGLVPEFINNISANAPFVKGTNNIKLDVSAEWKTVTISLTDFVSGTYYYSDLGSYFKIGSAGTSTEGAYIWVKNIKVTPIKEESGETVYTTPDKSERYPNGVSITFGENENISNGLINKNNVNYTLNPEASANDGKVQYINIGGTWALASTSYLGKDGAAPEGFDNSDKTYRNRPTYLYFGVDNDYMYDEKDNYAEVEIEYYDCSKYNMSMSYVIYENGKNITVYASKIRQGGTNTWKTAVFTVNNANFKDQQGSTSYPCDFNLRLEADDEGTATKQLILRKVTVRNLGSKKQQDISETPKIYIAGDSIAADYSARPERPAGSPDDETKLRYGWGEKLGFNGTEIVNYGVPGASTKDFEYFDKISESADKGDYVFISFGHNDSISESNKNYAAKATTPAEYKENLKTFIKELLNCQVTPVLITSIPVFDYANDIIDSSSETLAPYRAAALELAEEMSLASVDLAAEFKALLEKEADKDGVDTYYVQDENGEGGFYSGRTHLSEKGAEAVAGIIMNSVKANGKINGLK